MPGCSECSSSSKKIAGHLTGHLYRAPYRFDYRPAYRSRTSGHESLVTLLSKEVSSWFATLESSVGPFKVILPSKSEKILARKHVRGIFLLDNTLTFTCGDLLWSYFLINQRRRDDNKNNMFVLEGGVGGREENCPKMLFLMGTATTIKF